MIQNHSTTCLQWRVLLAECCASSTLVLFADSPSPPPSQEATALLYSPQPHSHSPVLSLFRLSLFQALQKIYPATPHLSNSILPLPSYPLLVLWYFDQIDHYPPPHTGTMVMTKTRWSSWEENDEFILCYLQGPGTIPIKFILKDGTEVTAMARDGEIALRLAQR